jgi:hypothetical protein
MFNTDRDALIALLECFEENKVTDKEQRVESARALLNRKQRAWLPAGHYHETNLSGTNLWLETTIDPRRGVQIVCDQRLDDIGGPRVTVTHGGGWSIHVRERAGEPWAVHLNVPACGQPLLRSAGVSLGALLYDDDPDEDWNDE